MDYLFVSLCFISPLPACLFIARAIKKHESELAASVGSRFSFSASGFILTYLLILFVNIALLYPKLFALDFLTDVQKWRYSSDIYKTCDKETHYKRDGVIRIITEKGQMFRVNDISENVHDQRTKEGLMNGHHIFLPLSGQLLPDNLAEPPSLVAYGSYQHAGMRLSIYSIATRNVAQVENWQGHIHLERIWPYGKLALLTILPLVILICLRLISPVFAKININVSSGGFLNLKNMTLHLGISSALSLYLIMVMILYLIASGTSLITLLDFQRSAVVFCSERLKNFYFTAHIHRQGTITYQIASRGRISLRCQGSDLSFSGFCNPKSYTTKLAYEVKHPMGQDLHLELWGTHDNHVLAVYRIGNAENRIGFISGYFYEGARYQILDFHDLRSQAEKFYISISGQLRVYEKIPEE